MQPNAHNREKSEEEFFEDIFVKFVLPIWRIESEIWKWRRENIQTNLCFLSICFTQPACHKLFSRKISGIYRKDFCPRGKTVKNLPRLQDSHQTSKGISLNSTLYYNLKFVHILAALEFCLVSICWGQREHFLLEITNFSFKLDLFISVTRRSSRDVNQSVSAL